MAVPKPTEFYRFRQQKGRNIEVMFRHDGRWISTGTREPIEAAAFAERNIHSPETGARSFTFKAYTFHFFIRGRCPWLDRMNRDYDDSTIERYRRHLTLYLWPKFGTTPLTAITRRDIDLYLRHLRLEKSGALASSETKNKILSTMRAVMDQAHWDGLVSGDEAALAKMYNVDDATETKPFEREEYLKFFPADPAEIERIWGGPFWYTFFLLLAVTGARPGQVAALKWSCWFPDLNGLWSYEGVDARTGELKPIKTAKRGVSEHAMLLTDRANKALADWREITRHKDDDDLIFHWRGPKRDTLQANTILKHLRAAAGRAEVEIGDRTTYSWRHSYTTDMLELLDEEDVQDLIGHVKGSKTTKRNYDHRKAEQQIRSLRNRAQFAVERRFA